MPEDFRKFRKKIMEAGYFVEKTKSNHYAVKTEAGEVVEMFAVSHGRWTRGGEVWDSYVNLIMKAIARHQQGNR